MKTKLLSSSIIAATLLTLGMGANTAFAADTATDDSLVTAEVVTGGMELEAFDVALGELTIGTPIPDKTVDKHVTVTDHTGGKGWDLTVAQPNFANEESNVFHAIKFDSGTKTNITASAAKVATGESTLAAHDLGSVLSSTWGTAPKAAEFSVQLDWTASPTVAEGTGDQG